METASVVTFGIVMLIVSIIVSVAGILLLVFGIIKTVKGKKRVGMIVSGGILTLIGMPFVLVSLLFNVYGSNIRRAMNTPSENSSTLRITMDAFKSNDPDELYKLFAKEGYTGEALTREDAKEFFSMIDGKVTKIDVTGSGLFVNHGTKSTEFTYLIGTDKGERYSVTFDYMTKDSNQNCIGIQYLRLKQGRDTLCVFGKEPKIK
ncbi:MAG: DUF5104 domain-containing protein [Clostridiales bacterium]|nr:DUF5104 domain-containing protein [Clostridiales bacterium]